MKNTARFLTSTVIFLLSNSCNNNQQNKINYPFNFIDKKIESRSIDNNHNEMILYSAGDNPSLDTLKMFCSKLKKEFTNGYFHIVVFFDKSGNATFPDNPVTAGFNDERQAKHIKAIYTFNNINGYSKMDYFEKNLWESKAFTVEVK